MADDWSRVFGGFDGIDPPADLWDRAVARATAVVERRPRRFTRGWRVAGVAAVVALAALGAGLALRGSGGTSGAVFRTDGFNYYEQPLGRTIDQWPSVRPCPCVAFPQLQAVSAASGSNAWIVGDAAAWHWTGGTWSAVRLPKTHPASRLFAVADVDPTLAWAVGWTQPTSGEIGVTRPLVERWNGARWSVQPIPEIGSGWLTAVSTDSPTDAWATGVVFPHAAAHPTSDDQETLVLHWDGTHWSRVPPALPAQSQGVQITALGPADVWLLAGSPGGYDNSWLEHWNGRGWQRVPTPFGPNDPPAGFAALSDGDVWAVGGYRLSGQRADTLAAHWDGRTWSIAPTPNQGQLLRRRRWRTTAFATPYTDNQLQQVVAVSPTDIWAFGQTYYQHGSIIPRKCRRGSDECSYVTRGSNPVPLALHWDGRRWNLAPAPRTIPNIDPFVNATTSPGYAAMPGGGVWAIGSTVHDNLIERWDGHSWRVVPHPPDRTIIRRP